MAKKLRFDHEMFMPIALSRPMMLQCSKQSRVTKYQTAIRTLIRSWQISENGDLGDSACMLALHNLEDVAQNLADIRRDLLKKMGKDRKK
jgi:hypothetical protein